MDDRRNVRELDATGLRALAHPIRMKLLNLLITEPATASQLARTIGESSGTTSWHLRQLAEYGFVTEDTELGTRRERWWRAVVDGTRFEDVDLLDDPTAAGALESFLYTFVTDQFDHVVRHIGAIRELPRDWLRASSLSNARLSLTLAELREFGERIEALIESYRREPADGDRQVRVGWQVYPERGDEA